MAMKAAVTAVTAASRLRGQNRLFASSVFNFDPFETSHSPDVEAEPSTRLFVSGLSKRTTTEGLRAAFSKFGEVLNAKVLSDRVTGYSRGFGFVKYPTIKEAENGIKGMHGQTLDGWVINVEFSKPRLPPGYQQQNGSNPVGRSSF